MWMWDCDTAVKVFASTVVDASGVVELNLNSMPFLQ